jgi:hypothetical protein
MFVFGVVICNIVFKDFVFAYFCECDYEIEFVFGVAEAERWFGAIITIFFG